MFDVRVSMSTSVEEGVLRCRLGVVAFRSSAAGTGSFSISIWISPWEGSRVVAGFCEILPWRSRSRTRDEAELACR